MNDDIRIGLAEAIGTAVLVFGGAGTAIFATSGFGETLSVGILGVALAFGFSLLCMAYLIGLLRWQEDEAYEFLVNRCLKGTDDIKPAAVAIFALGRLATRVATFLRGKHKPTFTANLDMGDNVIVINASDVKLTGLKLDKKVYLRHTGWMGGQKATTMRTLLEKHPDRVLSWGPAPRRWGGGRRRAPGTADPAPGLLHRRRGALLRHPGPLRRRRSGQQPGRRPRRPRQSDGPACS